MKIKFHKYQGTGNDFIMLNNLNGEYDSLSILQISQLCDRRFGIGADGLIKINRHDSLDFEVDYYNADGSKSFCGNGARCSVKFAKSLGINVDSTNFLGIDGKHNAFLDQNDLVHLEMSHISEIDYRKPDYCLHTGSPHYVHFIDDLSIIDIVKLGKSIRHSSEFEKEGINVNAVEIISEKSISILTYERGVEDETLSCGTGATACAIAFANRNNLTGEITIDVKVKGGDLKVSFNASIDGIYSNVRLIGPAAFVFKGETDV